MKELTDNNFDNVVLKPSRLVVVDFWAEWCNPCKIMHVFLKEINKEYSKDIDIYTVNVEKSPMTANKYKIIHIPTLLFFKDGHLLDKKMGVNSKSTIESKINELLKENGTRSLS